VIGADSKLTTAEGKEYQLACKIGIARNVVWAAAGGLRFTDNGSVADIVSTEMTKLLQIQPTLQNIMNVLSIRVSAVISYLRAANLPIARDIGVTITFGYFEDNVLNIDFNQIKLLDQAGPSDTLQTIRRHCPNDTGCKTSDTSAMGQFETIQAELSSDPNIVKRLGPKGAIEHFIEEESVVHPDTVGGPIAIVRLSGNGIQWIEKGKCDNP
jgi:hypothetical protein